MSSKTKKAAWRVAGASLEKDLVEARRKVPSVTVRLRVPKGTVKCVREAADVLFLYKGGSYDRWELCRGMMAALEASGIIDVKATLVDGIYEKMSL